jgi:hypothetical protein
VTLARSDVALEEAHQLCAFIRCLGPKARKDGCVTPQDELRQIKAEQIRTKREAAMRARRLAVTFWSETDRNNALQLAEELEAQADELARFLAAEAAGDV